MSKHWNYAQRSVSRINEMAICNADRFVISPYINDGLIQFIKNRRHHQTKFQPVVAQTPNGPVVQTRLVNNFENASIRIPKFIKYNS